MARNEPAKLLTPDEIVFGPRYRVCWRVVANGYSGHGDWHPDRRHVEAWVEAMNKKYDGSTDERPAVLHWIESEVP